MYGIIPTGMAHSVKEYDATLWVLSKLLINNSQSDSELLVSKIL